MDKKIAFFQITGKKCSGHFCSKNVAPLVNWWIGEYILLFKKIICTILAIRFCLEVVSFFWNLNYWNNCSGQYLGKNGCCLLFVFLCFCVPRDVSSLLLLPIRKNSFSGFSRDMLSCTNLPYKASKKWGILKNEKIIIFYFNLKFSFGLFQKLPIKTFFEIFWVYLQKKWFQFF